MTERAKEARREYLRKYRREHPEKIKEINERYWERKAQKMADGEAYTELDEWEENRTKSK